MYDWKHQDPRTVLKNIRHVYTVKLLKYQNIRIAAPKREIIIEISYLLLLLIQIYFELHLTLIKLHISRK